MATNVAGTNAIANELVSQIQNARILMGEAPPAPLTSSPLQQQVSAAQTSNTDVLFGISAPAADPLASALLASAEGTFAPPATSTLQSAISTSAQANTDTLFGIPGYGENVNTTA